MLGVDKTENDVTIRGYKVPMYYYKGQLRTMALLEVKVFQTYDNSQCVTTFNYLSVGTPAAVTESFALMAAMGFILGITPEVGNVYGDWQAAVNAAVLFTEVQIKSIYSVTDFYTLPLPAGDSGAQAGIPSPAFVCYSLQTNRVRSDVRRGNRRLVGCNEESLDNFGEIIAGQNTILTQTALSMSAVLTYDDEGNTLSFTPLIISKEKYVAPSGQDAYRYYSTLELQTDHMAVGIAWTPKLYASTQVSRKRGRGI